MITAGLPSCRTPNASRSLEDEVAGPTPGAPGDLTLVGLVPGRYAGGGEGYALAKIATSGGIIRTITPVNERDLEGLATQPGTLVLRSEAGLDVIYPGMINLHNHTKQNVLQVWDEAKGQFANRFEWRDWGNYKKAVSFNMNPWVDDAVATCAAFRWSELAAMVQGTTYLQGPSSCIDKFAISQVEDGDAYLEPGPNRLANVSAPTDLVIPEDMVFVYKDLKPLIDGGMKYEQALLQKINEICPRLVAKFERDRVYAEQEVNAVLDTWASFRDAALLRRTMVEEHLLERTPDGSEYRVVG
jgi:hypothetical protein